MMKKIYCAALLLSPSVVLAAPTQGISYVEGSSSSPLLSVCANTSTPLPIFIATLRDFGVTSKYSNRVEIKVTADYWSEKERGIPIKSSSFFSMDTVYKPNGKKPTFGQSKDVMPVSPLPMSAREYPNMSVADSGIGRPTKTHRKRNFEPYYSQIVYTKEQGRYTATYRPKEQMAGTKTLEVIRQPDDIIWLPSRSIKTLTIQIKDLEQPKIPPGYEGLPPGEVTFIWEAKAGYNPKTATPPILELKKVTYSGKGNSKWGTSYERDEETGQLAHGNVSVHSSITLGETYTLDMKWNRSPVIRELATSELYSAQFLRERDAFRNGNLSFGQLVSAAGYQKLSEYDMNLKKLDFIYANIDAKDIDFHMGHGGKYRVTYFRGSINAYNNVYIDYDEYKKNGSVLKTCD